VTATGSEVPALVREVDLGETIGAHRLGCNADLTNFPLLVVHVGKFALLQVTNDLTVDPIEAWSVARAISSYRNLTFLGSYEGAVYLLGLESDKLLVWRLVCNDDFSVCSEVDSSYEQIDIDNTIRDFAVVDFSVDTSNCDETRCRHIFLAGDQTLTRVDYSLVNNQVERLHKRKFYNIDGFAPEQLVAGNDVDVLFVLDTQSGVLRFLDYAFDDIERIDLTDYNMDPNDLEDVNLIPQVLGAGGQDLGGAELVLGGPLSHFFLYRTMVTLDKTHEIRHGDPSISVRVANNGTDNPTIWLVAGFQEGFGIFARTP
jgi:hypothetical protein